MAPAWWADYILCAPAGRQSRLVCWQEWRGVGQRQAPRQRGCGGASGEEGGDIHGLLRSGPSARRPHLLLLLLLVLLQPHLLLLLLALLLLEDLEQHRALLVGGQLHQLLLHLGRQGGVDGRQLLLHLLLLHLLLGLCLGSWGGGRGRLLLRLLLLGHALGVQLLQVLQLGGGRQLRKLLLCLGWQAANQLLHHQLLLLGGQRLKARSAASGHHLLLLLPLLHQLLHDHLAHVGRHVGQLGSNGGVHLLSMSRERQTASTHASAPQLVALTAAAKA